MNLVIVVNQKYVKYVCVMLNSLFESNKGAHTIYILYEEIDEKSIEQINRFVERKGSKSIWIHEDSQKYRKFPMWKNWSYETYFILRAHELLPNDLERILYLDIDLIVMDSLEKLYNLDFEDNYIAARKTILDKGDAVELYKEGKTFLNSGVILFNLKKMRKEICFDDFLVAAEKMKYSFYMDEALLSYVMYGKVCFIERKYNYWLDDNCDQSGDAVIIHYICPEHPYKPWDLYFTNEELDLLSELKQNPVFRVNSSINRLIGLWWKHVYNVPFSECILEEANAKKEWFIRSLYDFIISQIVDKK